MVTLPLTDSQGLADPRSAACFETDYARQEAYDEMSCLVLPESVPAPVRQYFDATRTLWFHGWHCYEFYGWSDLHARVCVENALRLRLERDDPSCAEKVRGLRRLLDAAVARGYLRAEILEVQKSGSWAELLDLTLFSYRVRAEIDELGRDVSEFVGDVVSSEPPVTFGAELARAFAKARNQRAHGMQDSVGAPLMGACAIDLARAVILQLFPTSLQCGPA
jgi:uncharacterized protein (DUF2132 family)